MVVFHSYVSFPEGRWEIPLRKDKHLKLEPFFPGYVQFSAGVDLEN